MSGEEAENEGRGPGERGRGEFDGLQGNDFCEEEDMTLGTESES